MVHRRHPEERVGRPAFSLGNTGNSDAEGDAAEVMTSVEQQVDDVLARDLPEVDLRAVGVGGSGGSTTLTVVIDHPAGVTHSLCEQVTRALDHAGLRDRFTIEVSSPGPEPPLRVTRHFLSAIGGTVRLAVEPGSVPGRAKSVTGTLVEASDDVLRVETTDGDVTIPRSAVSRARVVQSTVTNEGRSTE